MAWLSLSIRTDCQHAEALADALLDAGALAASIEDAAAGTSDEQPQFGEPGSVSRPGWERSLVVALLKPDTDVRPFLASCAARAGLATLPDFTLEEVAEQDWVKLTQSQFEPIRVSARLWIVPSWHEALLIRRRLSLSSIPAWPSERVRIRPPVCAWNGLSAGVGPGMSVLDYGCGSGILAIAAARLGATDVVGVDIDPQAVTSARNNAESNRVSARFQDSACQLTGQFDRVVANILANPLKVLAPAISAHVRPGGSLALSGILVEQTEELIAAYAPFLRLAVADARDGWVCLAGVRE
jgi:ribosomal protein L11 methyltransferase